MDLPAPSYRCHRYPAEVIAQCVRLHRHIPLSCRSVAERMLERGIPVSHESIRLWARKFGPSAPSAPRPLPGDTWRMVETRITMNGRPYHLWRATDADGATLDILAQERRDAAAAERCLRRLVAG